LNTKHIGTLLLISGSVVSVAGAYSNNIYLDHKLAMQIWRVSNILLFAWAIGLWRKWWCGGLPAVVLAGMYAFYEITNEIGLE
jgi:hypothetical protein